MAAVGGAILLLAILANRSGVMGQPVSGGSPVGSWYVVPGGGGPARMNLITLASDGNVLWTGGIGTYSDGHGAWEKTGERTARFTFVFIRHSPSGEIIGTSKSSGTMSYDSTFKQFDGSIQSDQFDLQGEKTASTKFTSHGTRINVEPL
jgi:hypothetical protein